MANLDLLSDQRAYLRRHPGLAKAVLHHFRVRLSSRVNHDVMAANADDARKHVKRFAGRSHIVEIVRMDGRS